MRISKITIVYYYIVQNAIIENHHCLLLVGHYRKSPLLILLLLFFRMRLSKITIVNSSSFYFSECDYRKSPLFITCCDYRKSPLLILLLSIFQNVIIENHHCLLLVGDYRKSPLLILLLLSILQNANVDYLASDTCVPETTSRKQYEQTKHL